MNIIPVDETATRETYDFHFETAEPIPSEWEAIAYIRDVLQREDIDIVESLQRANLVNWLSGPEARYASGQLWVIDGGLTAQVQQMRRVG